MTEEYNFHWVIERLKEGKKVKTTLPSGGGDHILMIDDGMIKCSCGEDTVGDWMLEAKWSLYDGEFCLSDHIINDQRYKEFIFTTSTIKDFISALKGKLPNEVYYPSESKTYRIHIIIDEIVGNLLK